MNYNSHPLRLDELHSYPGIGAGSKLCNKLYKFCFDVWIRWCALNLKKKNNSRHFNAYGCMHRSNIL